MKTIHLDFKDPLRESIKVLIFLVDLDIKDEDGLRNHLFLLLIGSLSLGLCSPFLRQSSGSLDSLFVIVISEEVIRFIPRDSSRRSSGLSLVGNPRFENSRG
eukprot:TRINITY_DN32518_c0_g1_i1.p3 TRINITY_DN32518_c0_g1~~TRINITY_DN32518_c0_g1_i1.p3  ORF type:complete len:102 (-),score=26.29 TRINITY_DN32518_c0_g1_i1:58-363(-)